jgi:hypothetical protein
MALALVAVSLLLRPTLADGVNRKLLQTGENMTCCAITEVVHHLPPTCGVAEARVVRSA